MNQHQTPASRTRAGQQPAPPVTPSHRRGRSFVFAAALCCLPLAFDEGRAAVDGARAALEKWVETRRIVSAERRDWALGREILSDRIALVRREIDSLRGSISEAEQSIAEADRKRAELVADNERLQQAGQSLRGTVVTLEASTRSLLQRLPDPIRERVKPLSQRLPDEGAESKLSLGERFQNVVGILNEVNKFQREITVTSEVRTLPSGAQAEVTALYVGIGQAYYVSGDGRSAGVGRASAEGWIWSEANAAAAEIAAAIAIHKNEQVADFVQLPFQLDAQDG
ncbi:MAG: DUF3450 family protein [Planctomycetota bacterium]